MPSSGNHHRFAHAAQTNELLAQRDRIEPRTHPIDPFHGLSGTRISRGHSSHNAIHRESEYKDGGTAEVFGQPAACCAADEQPTPGWCCHPSAVPREAGGATLDTAKADSPPVFEATKKASSSVIAHAEIRVAHGEAELDGKQQDDGREKEEFIRPRRSAWSSGAA